MKQEKACESGETALAARRVPLFLSAVQDWRRFCEACSSAIGSPATPRMAWGPPSDFWPTCESACSLQPAAVLSQPQQHEGFLGVLQVHFLSFLLFSAVPFLAACPGKSSRPSVLVLGVSSLSVLDERERFSSRSGFSPMDALSRTHTRTHLHA